MGFFELSNVAKSYGTGYGRTSVLANVDLSIDEGEFVAIVGFSGSGKTTLISLMAGLISPDSGSITLAGRPVEAPDPERGVVFQSYSLLPWLTVHGNVLLAVRKVHPSLSRREQEERTDAYVDMVGLTAARAKRPRELSGGMRQRVALARGLAMDPRVLLLDEPLSALDALTRATLQDEIEAIWRRDRKTIVMITNDVDEALLLADRIVPLRPGPGATLGPCFPVDLERPRDRAALNHDPSFKKLRAEITGYLMRVRGHEERDARPRLHPPTIQPIELNPPKQRYLR